MHLSTPGIVALELREGGDWEEADAAKENGQGISQSYIFMAVILIQNLRSFRIDL